MPFWFSTSSASVVTLVGIAVVCYLLLRPRRFGSSLARATYRSLSAEHRSIIDLVDRFITKGVIKWETFRSVGNPKFGTFIWRLDGDRSVLLHSGTYQSQLLVTRGGRAELRLVCRTDEDALVCRLYFALATRWSMSMSRAYYLERAEAVIDDPERSWSCSIEASKEGVIDIFSTRNESEGFDVEAHFRRDDPVHPFVIRIVSVHELLVLLDEPHDGSGFEEVRARVVTAKR